MIKAITYILENDATVSGLLGTNRAGLKSKVYPVFVPSTEKFPYIVCTLSDRTRVAKSCPDDWTVQVVCVHNSYDKVTELNEAVIEALDRYTGSVNGVDVSFINFISESDSSYEKENGLFVKVQTYTGKAVITQTT